MLIENKKEELKMQKVELNIENRENLEKEGYTLRVENGITYIEKEEKTNHNQYGECFSFFQKKIELDINGKEIITETNRLYKKEKINVVYGKQKDVQKDLESESLIFEDKKLIKKRTDYYSNAGDSILCTKIIDFISLKETEIKNGAFQKIQSIKVSDINSNVINSYTEFDKDGKIIYSLNDKLIERSIKTKFGLIEESFNRISKRSILKIEGIEMPISSIEKYKQICEKFQISPLSQRIEITSEKSDIKLYKDNERPDILKSNNKR